MPYKNAADKKANGRRYCKRRRAHIRQVQARWRKNNPEKDRANRRRERAALNADPSRKKQRIDKVKAKRAALRRRLLRMYGNECACCGERHPHFLTFDHVDNDGALLRRCRIVGERFYRWLLKKRRKDIQVLCFNCNCSRGFYGSCPHTRLR